MCNSGYFLSYVHGWLGYVYARSFLASTNTRFYKELDREMLNKRQLRKLSTRLPWFADIYKRKSLCIFQATNEVMFLSWSLTKRQNTFFCNTFILKFERMYLPKMRACGYDVTRETAKS